MRVLLVQWDEDGAERRAASLRAAGHEVLVESRDGAQAYRLARAERPDVVVLDLAARASHSWQTARPLARLAQPPRLVFLDGDPAARERALREAPGAELVAGDGLEATLAAG